MAFLWGGEEGGGVGVHIYCSHSYHLLLLEWNDKITPPMYILASFQGLPGAKDSLKTPNLRLYYESVGGLICQYFISFVFTPGRSFEWFIIFGTNELHVNCFKLKQLKCNIFLKYIEIAQLKITQILIIPELKDLLFQMMIGC